jgi:hypothetical protein
MIHPYISVALLSATYEVDSDDFTYGSIPLLPAVTATGINFNACRQQLRTQLEQYIVDQLRVGVELPVLHGVMPPTTELELQRRNHSEPQRSSRRNARLG